MINLKFVNFLFLFILFKVLFLFLINKLKISCCIINIYFNIINIEIILGYT